MKTNDYQKFEKLYCSRPIVFPFGHYRDNPVIWRVLASTVNEVLVISDYAIELDGMVADTFEPPLLTYSSEWLNQTFLNDAFSDSEQQMILDTEVNYMNERVEKNKIWMLSMDEAEELFVSDYERCAYATEYVKSRRPESEREDTIAWGLRKDNNLNLEDEEYCFVDPKGCISFDDNEWLWFLGVRPVMWIKKSCVPERIRSLIINNAVFYTQKMIHMGRYRDRELSWTELDCIEGKRLLLCNNIIEYLPFHKQYEPVTWDICTLREWLNQEFYYTAFNGGERQQISPTINRTKNCQDTNDYVWLLSADEANRYFNRSYSERKVMLDGPCKYLERKNIGQYIGIRQKDIWLLRSNAGHGNNKCEVSNVIDYSEIRREVNEGGRNLNVNCIAGIRPSIWIVPKDREHYSLNYNDIFVYNEWGTKY